MKIKSIDATHGPVNVSLAHPVERMRPQVHEGSAQSMLRVYKHIEIPGSVLNWRRPETTTHGIFDEISLNFKPEAGERFFITERNKAD